MLQDATAASEQSASDCSGKQKGRGKMSGYTVFLQMCKEEHESQFPDVQITDIEFDRKCQARWKAMTKKEKQKFELLSKSK